AVPGILGTAAVRTAVDTGIRGALDPVAGASAAAAQRLPAPNARTAVPLRGALDRGDAGARQRRRRGLADEGRARDPLVGVAELLDLQHLVRVVLVAVAVQVAAGSQRNARPVHSRVAARASGGV